MESTMIALVMVELGKKAELKEVARPEVRDGSVLIRTCYSGISFGTEMWGVFGISDKMFRKLTLI